MKKSIRIFIAILISIICVMPAKCDDIPLFSYTDLKKYNEYSPDGEKPVSIEIIVGRTEDDTKWFPETEVWIKDYEGYGYCDVAFRKLRNEFKYGQKYHITIKPYGDGSFGGDSIIDKQLIEEEVDVEQIMREYKDSYKQYKYKKILRNPEEYYGEHILVEGIYIQDIDEYNKLIMDDDGDIYCFSYLVKEYEHINILLNDRLKLYCRLSEGRDGIYTYESWVGKQTVPAIYVDFIELLEED